MKLKWFTVIEIVIAISILTILGTLWFVQISSYLWNARDATRLTNVTNIINSFELHITWWANLPVPDNWREITYDGTTLWTQWVFWENTSRAIEDFSEIPQDVKYWNLFTYSLLNDGSQYQIWTIIESEEISHLWIEQTYANENTKAYVRWKFDCWHLEKIGDKHILIPSITTSNQTETDYEVLVENKELVFDGSWIYPSSFSSLSETTQWTDFGWSDIDFVIYEWDDDSLLEIWELDVFATNINQALSWSLLVNESCYKPNVVLKNNFWIDAIFAQAPKEEEIVEEEIVEEEETENWWWWWWWNGTPSGSSNNFEWIPSSGSDFQCRLNSFSWLECDIWSIDLGQGYRSANNNKYQYFVNWQQCGEFRDITYTWWIDVADCFWAFNEVWVDNEITMYIPSAWWYEETDSFVSMALPRFNLAALIVIPNGKWFDFTVNTEQLTTDFRFYVDWHYCHETFPPWVTTTWRVDRSTDYACWWQLDNPWEHTVEMAYDIWHFQFRSDPITITID